jgi:hypothetical protein
VLLVCPRCGKAHGRVFAHVGARTCTRCGARGKTVYLTESKPITRLPNRPLAAARERAA